jgi:phosphate-selective porin OprO/OprP
MRRGLLRAVGLLSMGLLAWLVLGKEAVRSQPNLPDDGLGGQSQASAPAEDATQRAARIEKRLKDLERQNRLLMEKFDAINQRSENSTGKGGGKKKDSAADGKNSADQDSPGGNEESADGQEEVKTGSGGASRPGGAAPKGSSRTGGAGGPPQEERKTGAGGEAVIPRPEWQMQNYMDNRGPYVRNMDPPLHRGGVEFGEGMEWTSQDGFISVVFHNLSQFDYRLFSPTGDPLKDSFEIPRQRWYFQGTVSPYATFYTVINRGYGSLDILDSWVDFNFAPRYKNNLQFRVGRMKTPFTYEYIKVSESDLIAPERSVFVGNFVPNRQDGAMAHGRLFANSLEYYAGAFNTQRRSFQDYTSSKEFVGFLNWKPFLFSDVELLKNLNVAGSFTTTGVRDPLQPAELRTASDQSPGATADTVSPTFLAFNSNVFENGYRTMWAGDVAWYYKSLTFLGNYEGGFNDYSIAKTATTTPTIPGVPTGLSSASGGTIIGVDSNTRYHVPLLGWSAALTYFITGEQITRRVYLLEPIRPFGIYNGRLNPGAIELYSRIANIQLGDQVFKDGLVDPHFWSNRATVLDTGVNWYLNHYVRMYFDWQHSFFNNPTYISPGHFTKHMDLFWLRTQVFF